MIKILRSISDIGSSFNKEQIEAIEEVNGYIFNSAPPGSGKTFVLENRILWLALEHQVPTRNILAITFTNEAASEMKERISERLNEFNINNDVTATTFHSFAYHMIRKFGNGIVSKYFTLIDEVDKNKLVKKVIERDSSTEKPGVKEICQMISNYKTKGITIKNLWENLNENRNELLELKENEKKRKELNVDEFELKLMAENIKQSVKEYFYYNEYEKEKNSYNGTKSMLLYDFDDLMINLKKLLTNESIRKKISSLFTYVLCDEAQDIDEVQRDILLLLSKDNKNLFCIFDDDQSIYSFRNADPNLILGLPNIVENPKKIVLKENFRSTENIINAANYLIMNNRYRISKWMTTKNPLGEKVKYVALPSKEKESEFIISEIKRLKEEKGYKYSDFAILYRNNDLNKTIEQKLIKECLPYRINRNISFFQRKEIKDMIAYLEVIVSNSAFHLDRIWKVPPRGIGDKTIEDLYKKAKDCGMDIFEILSTDKRAKIQEFYELIQELKRNTRDKDLSDTIDFIIEKTNYYQIFDEKEVPARENNISNLKNILFEISKIVESKEEILIQLKIISGDDVDATNRDDKINLMTMHSSKGKGFKVVFIIGCEKGIIPSFASITETEIEEERRLFYVGITRAKELCYLTRSQYRIDYSGNLKPTTISGFINEIPDDYLEFNEENVF